MGKRKNVSHNAGRAKVRVHRIPNEGKCPETGKQRWESRRGARQHIRSIANGDKRADQLRAYRCEAGCGAWHVGHRLPSIGRRTNHESD